ncbi:hypothetical protein KEM56_001788, partial [Ascosphaera pollenicola]
MAYFTAYPSYNDSLYSPIFQLLDDIDGTSRPSIQSARNDNHNVNNNPAATHTSPAGPAAKFIQSFSPRFDVRESKDAYLLDGELPGCNQKDIDIEFTDLHTLRIKGVVKRQYTNTNILDDSNDDEHDHQEKEIDDDASSIKSSNSRQATVEDADDEEDGLVKKTSSSAAPNENKVAKKPAATTIAKKNETPAIKYWSSERAIGSFHRTFNFPARVNQDAVRANLKDGILSVVVPKEVERKTGRKIM